MENTCVVLLIVLALAGCNPVKLESSAVSASEHGDATSNISYSENDVIQYFEYLAYGEGCTVTDCVLADDFAYGLIGVVQYTDEEGNGCNLSFIKKNKVGVPIGLDAEGSLAVANNSVLAYLGNGTVNLLLTKIEAKDLYAYSVEYSYSEQDNATRFVVSSTERDGL